MRAATDLVEPTVAARTIVAVDVNGRVSTGAQAIFTIAGRTGGVIGLAGRIFAPRPISLLLEPGYRLFARHRGRLARFFKDPE